MQNNTATNRGGGVLSNGTLTVQNSAIITGNSANQGAGIFSTDTLIVNSSSVTSNTATGAGGGINCSGTATITNSTLGNNSASDGGGISSSATLSLSGTTVTTNTSTAATPSGGGGISTTGTATIDSSTITGNSAANGGGILESAGSLTVRNNTTISNNQAGGDGYGVFLGGGSATLSNTTFTGNFASSALSGSGSALCNRSNGTIDIQNCTISGNSAATGPGGGVTFWTGAGTVTIANTSISANTGIGMFCGGGTLTVTGTTINNNTANAGTLAGGGMYIAAGTVTIQGSSTLNNNTAGGDGGGMYVAGGSVTIDSSTLSGNSAANGAGIYQSGGTLRVQNNVTLQNNTASNSGGGIYLAAGTCDARNSTIDGNRANSVLAAQGGAGIYNSGVLSITSCTVSNNVCGTWDGGGLNNHAGGIATITASTFTGNIAPLGGGAFYNDSGSTLLLRGCFISANSATGTASAIGTALSANWITAINSTFTGNTGASTINIQSANVATFVNCTISGNSGRGINVNAGTATIVACTITGNTAGVNGGGVNNSGTVTLLNSVVAGNTAPTGPDINNTGTITASSSLIGNTAASGILPGNGNILDPPAAGLATLGNNGGTPAPVTPPLTIPLLPSSPAIGTAGAATTLNAAIASGAVTSITISNMAVFAATALPLLASGSYFTLQIDGEQMDVIALTPGGGSTATLTVVRGTGATSAVGHAAGAAVFLISDERGSLPAFANTPPVLNMGAVQIASFTPGAVFTESGGSTDVVEAGASDTITVVLNLNPTANVIVTLTPAAPLGVLPALLTFTPANWNIVQTVTVSAADDFIVENPLGPRLYQRAISANVSSGDARFNASPSLTANITDIDVAGVTLIPSGGSTSVSESGPTSDTYAVVLNTQPAANVVVSFTPDPRLNVAQIRVTFTPALWNVAQTVTLSAIDDSVAENPVSPFRYTGLISCSVSSSDGNYAGLTPAPLTVDIIDNDSPGVVSAATGGSTDVVEGGAGDTGTVVLTSQPTANVIVTLNPGTQLTATPLRLTFTPANWNIRQVVTVRAVDDVVYQGTRTVPFAFSASSADPFYMGLSIANLPVTITDDDPAPSVIITRTPGAVPVLEGTAQSYSVVLSTPPAADVVVNASTDSQVSVSATTLTFTPSGWNIPQPVVLTANDDGNVEGPHFGMITHFVTSADAAYSSLSLPTITADIVDNDGPTITGTDKADKIVITFTPQNILVSVNYQVTTLAATYGQMVLLAGGGDDHIEVINPSVPVIVLGGAGKDRLFVNGQVAGSNNFTLNAASVTTNGVGVGLWDVESLVVTGGKNTDRFTVAAIPAVASEIKGDLGSDIVLGPQRSNTWKINTANGGTLDSSIKLNGIENWTGGAGADTFSFSPGKSVSGILDGGGGSDALDYTLVTSAITVNLQSEAATATGGFRNITRVVGGKSAADKLVGADQSNAWQITGASAGAVNGVAFQSIENLTGGNLDDTFVFADGQSIKGKIDGGAGSDALDYAAFLARPVVVNLQTKAATATAGIANIEQFTAGASSADILLGANKVNAWLLTGPGAGSVAGVVFTGFENLTGGALADTFVLDAAGDWFGTLNGGNGSDILTAYPSRTNSWLNTSPSAGTLNGRKFTSIETRR